MRAVENVWKILFEERVRCNRTVLRGEAPVVWWIAWWNDGRKIGDILHHVVIKKDPLKSDKLWSGLSILIW